MHLNPSPARGRRSLTLLAGLIMVALVITGCGQVPALTSSGSTPSPASGSGAAKDCEYTETGTPARPVSPPPSTGVQMSGTTDAVIAMESGKITITLDRDAAPCTVNSFVSLAKQKFFDNTDCPRMTVGSSLSMLQCGDPTGTQTGGPGYSFPDELSGDETYPAGTVAMANAGPNTNGSQFFLVYADSQLPPSYTVFGKMDQAGIAVLSKIAKGGVDNRNGDGDGKPKSSAKIISVTAGD